MNMENHRCGMFDHFLMSLQYISDDYLLHNMQLIKFQILYLIVSQNIYLQSQRCSVVWPLVFRV